MQLASLSRVVTTTFSERRRRDSLARTGDCRRVGSEEVGTNECRFVRGAGSADRDFCIGIESPLPPQNILGHFHPTVIDDLHQPSTPYLNPTTKCPHC